MIGLVDEVLDDCNVEQIDDLADKIAWRGRTGFGEQCTEALARLLFGGTFGRRAVTWPTIGAVLDPDGSCWPTGHQIAWKHKSGQSGVVNGGPEAMKREWIGDSYLTPDEFAKALIRRYKKRRPLVLEAQVYPDKRPAMLPKKPPTLIEIAREEWMEWESATTHISPWLYRRMIKECE